MIVCQEEEEEEEEEVECVCVCVRERERESVCALMCLRSNEDINYLHVFPERAGVCV